MERATPPATGRGAAVAGGATALVFLLWWLGWFPGIVDRSALDAVAEARRFDFSTDRPAAFSWLLWATTVGGRALWLHTLLQAVGFAAVLSLLARRLVHAGVPPWVAGVSVWLFALLPAVGVAAVTPAPHALLTLTALALFAELLEVARLGVAYWNGRSQVLLALVVVVGTLGAIGLLTAIVVVFVVALAFSFSPPARTLVGASLATIALAWIVLPLPFERTGGRLAESAAPIVASSLFHHADDMPDRDLARVGRFAPVDLWTDLYRCDDPAALVSDREFDRAEVAEHPGTFRATALRAFVRHPLTAVGQRWCAARSMLAPTQDAGDQFYLPAYTIPPNPLQVERSPRWWTAFTFTKAVLLRSERPDRLWVWWRPLLPLGVAAASYVVLGVRRRPETLTAAVVGGLLIATFIVGPATDAQITTPLYALGWVALPLLFVRGGSVPSERTEA